MVDNNRAYCWTIAAIGAALVALFIAAAATGAAGQDIPTQLWAAGGALSGALIGLLVPPPATNKRAAVGASVINNAAVIGAAKRTASIARSDASTQDKANAEAALAQVIAVSKFPTTERSPDAAIGAAIGRHSANAAAGVIDSVERAAALAALSAQSDATKTAKAVGIGSVVLDGGKILIPAIVAVAALCIGILIADGSIGYGGCSAVGALKTGQTAAPCATALFGAASALIALGAASAGGLVGLFAPTPAKST